MDTCTHTHLQTQVKASMCAALCVNRWWWWNKANHTFTHADISAALSLHLSNEAFHSIHPRLSPSFAYDHNCRKLDCRYSITGDIVQWLSPGDLHLTVYTDSWNNFKHCTDLLSDGPEKYHLVKKDPHNQSVCLCSQYMHAARLEMRSLSMGHFPPWPQLYTPFKKPACSSQTTNNGFTFTDWATSPRGKKWSNK